MRVLPGSFLVLVLCASAFAGCGGGGGGGDANGGSSGSFAEAWILTASGTVRGPFVCLTGTDSFYEERFQGSFAITIPLREMVQDTIVSRWTGSYSQVEIGVEASGQGCASPPSVASSETPPVMVTFRTGFGGPQIQISASSVLMAAHFSLGSGNEVLDSSFIVLDPTSITDAHMSGTWRAEPASNDSATWASGDFTLERVAVSAVEIASVSISADQTLGFLAPGTVVQLTAQARDSNGDPVPCQPVYRFANPVGGSVNVIQAIDATGRMTIGTEQGAARVWAECDGIVSNLLLVSGTG